PYVLPRHAFEGPGWIEGSAGALLSARFGGAEPGFAGDLPADGHRGRHVCPRAPLRRGQRRYRPSFFVFLAKTVVVSFWPPFPIFLLGKPIAIPNCKGDHEYAQEFDFVVRVVLIICQLARPRRRLQRRLDSRAMRLSVGRSERARAARELGQGFTVRPPIENLKGRQRAGCTAGQEEQPAR